LGEEVLGRFPAAFAACLEVEIGLDSDILTWKES